MSMAFFDETQGGQTIFGDFAVAMFTNLQVVALFPHSKKHEESTMDEGVDIEGRALAGVDWTMSVAESLPALDLRDEAHSVPDLEPAEEAALD